MNIAQFSVKQPVLTNMIMLLVFICGIYFYLNMPREILPLISLDTILITTLYPGATATEVESLVTQVIEDEIKNIEGVDEVTSTSFEGLSTIFISVLDGYDVYKVLQDIKSEVDKIQSKLPDETEDTEVKELKIEFPVCTVTVSGRVNEGVLRRYAKQLADKLKNIKGVSSINKIGYRDKEIWVEVNRDKLEQEKIPISAIISAIKRKNLNLPGGKLKTKSGEYLVRTLGEIQKIEDIYKIVLKSSKGVPTLFIEDIAKVKSTFEEKNSISKVNGEIAINLDVEKRKDGDTIKIVKNIKHLIKKLKKSYPDSIKLNIIHDRSIHIKDRIKLMQSNAIFGLFLVLISLYFFLNARLALMTALGIPFAFFGTFIIMKIYGMSINMISLFGMIIVLGMIVDDAIVICENFYRYLEMGSPPIEAAIKGANEVMWPVISAVLTTMAAFSPMLLMTGMMGKFLSNVPVVVNTALFCSLIEALLILPSHLADFVPPLKRQPSQNQKKHWYDPIFNTYENKMKKILKHRYFIAILLVLFVLTTLFIAKQMKFVLFGKVDFGIFRISMETFANSSLEQTERRVRKVERFIFQNIDNALIKNMSTRIGLYYRRRGGITKGDNKASIRVELNTEELSRKNLNTIKIINKLKKFFKKANFKKEFIYFNIRMGRGGPPVGDAISYRFKGNDLYILKKLVNKSKKFLSGLPGVVELSDDFPEGKKELVVELDEITAKTLGVDVMTLAQTIRSSINGEIASSIRTGDEEIKIRVLFDEKWRVKRSDISTLPVITQSGTHVLLADIAKIYIKKGNLKINRHNCQRIITLTGDVLLSKTTSLEVMKKFQKAIPEIFKNYPDYRVEFGGEAEDTKKSMQSLVYAVLLALLLIYMILGTQFQSFIHPFTVMVAIPFGFMGVMIAFYLTGNSLGLLAMMGVVALSGIVVNDSLVLIDFILRMRKANPADNLIDIVARAGRIRFRPILLTSITTILGLIPMCFATKGQAAFLAPMAQSLAWGLVFSTILTLIIIPCIYMIMEDIKTFLSKLFNKLDKYERI